MANKLFNQMNPGNNSPIGFFQALQQLKSKGGDPNQMIQNMLSSGQITQEQYNNAVQMAQQIGGMFVPFARR